MRTSLRVVRALAMALATLLLQDCKTGEDRAGAQRLADDAKARVDGGRRLRIWDGGGGLAMGPTKPDDFPADIPIYPGSTVALGGRSTGPGKPSWSLTVTTSDSKDQVAARYAPLLQGFEKVSDVNMGDAALSIWRSAAYDMTLMIGMAVNSKTTITLNVASK